jgi:hypothetical protein
LILADQGYTDEVIAERVGMHRRGVEGIRERFVEEGCEGTVEGKEGESGSVPYGGEDEARLIALVCGPVPEGYAQWTLRLIRD